MNSDDLFHFYIICLGIRCLRESVNWPSLVTYLPLGLAEKPSETTLASVVEEQASGFVSNKGKEISPKKNLDHS